MQPPQPPPSLSRFQRYFHMPGCTGPFDDAASLPLFPRSQPACCQIHIPCSNTVAWHVEAAKALQLSRKCTTFQSRLSRSSMRCPNMALLTRSTGWCCQALYSCIALSPLLGALLFLPCVRNCLLDREWWEHPPKSTGCVPVLEAFFGYACLLGGDDKDCRTFPSLLV